MGVPEILILLVIGLVVFGVVRAKSAGNVKRLASQKAQEAELQRLAELRQKMTDVEWEMYLVQYQNMQLNQEILKAARAPRFGYGVAFPIDGD